MFETEIVSDLITIGHRARLAFDTSCSVDDTTGQELLLLRALRTRKMTGRQLAAALGWSKSRVSQVAAMATARELIVREGKLTCTDRGLREANLGDYLLQEIGWKILCDLDIHAKGDLSLRLDRVAAKSAQLWRPDFQR